jgi:16S rRNA (uracil1498-N3)-methyltransferase
VNIFYQPHIPEGVNALDTEESRHCIRVLRKKSGDVIHLTDGKGFFYEALITNPDPAMCSFAIQTRTPEPRRDFSVHIAIAPTKNIDRIEWFVEKSVEIGVDKITLVECRNSERASVKLERLQKISVMAMKQSLKASLPTIKGVVSFADFVKSSSADQKFIAYVDPANPVYLKDASSRGSNCIVLIGPEGDFSNDELAAAIANGFVKVSLGRNRLRTETAGLAACHTLNLINS